MRNRLEQLRKRQRDEALQAQEELLAGVATKAIPSKHWGGDMRAEVDVDSEQDKVTMPLEEVEEYDRSMSPTLLDITKLPYEEREIDILFAEEDRKALVSTTHRPCHP